MKKLFVFLRKSKKAFTLMECVCAIAIVSLISAIVLPLTSGAIKSFRAADSMRKVASAASYKNATQASGITDPDTNVKNTKTLYVTISFTNPSMQAESAFSFTQSTSTDSKYDVAVTYYDLKYGREEEDPS